jgi:hypothetical protein
MKYTSTLLQQKQGPSQWRCRFHSGKTKSETEFFQQKEKENGSGEDCERGMKHVAGFLSHFCNWNKISHCHISTESDRVARNLYKRF